MEEDVARYREILLSEIQADAAAGGDYLSTRFVDRACQVLESGEEFTEYHICRGRGQTRKGGAIQVDGYSFSPSDGVLNLIVCEFSGAPDPDVLLTEDVRRLVNAGFRFIEGSVHESVAEQWDESHPVHALSREIFSFATSGEMSKANVYIVTDRPLGSSIGRMPQLAIGAQGVEVHFWDIGRLARVEASALGREEIEIDFLADFDRGIPALPAGLEADSRYDSYMCVVPGGILAALYDRFGGRILEQNVRAFLGDNRKVNRTIRETLRVEPEMFFAFNNGLTVTVSDIETRQHDDGHIEIVKAKGLQIVNGGQTTASLYWARKANVDISKVHVQMKLSRLPAEGFEDAVRNIARYANAQNAVSASDLFAGHPYFKRLEALSRQSIAPPAKTGEVNTYWYFERTTGSYKVDHKRKAGLAAKTWQMLNPKNQVITKTDVARYEVTFDCLPHSVCAGAQKNIAAFGKIIERSWETDPQAFDAPYFHRLVVRALITRAVDAMIPAQPWYPGSIVRPLSSYTLSLMCHRMRECRQRPDYEAIWRNQRAPALFLAEAMRIAKQVLPLLQEIPAEQVRNRLITEWVKRESCWERVKGSPLQLSEVFRESLVTDNDAYRPRENWNSKATLLWSNGEWKRLRDWNRQSKVLTASETELVDWAAVTSEFRPKGFRLTRLKEAWTRALSEGFA